MFRTWSFSHPLTCLNIMKRILVFLDFSATAVLAFDQALALAEIKAGNLSLCHITKDLDENIKKEVEIKMKPFIEKAKAKGVRADYVIETGELFEMAKQVTARLKPDLIVAGTHGSEGIHLRLFGSAIHKLVREVAAPTLVLGKSCKPISSGFKRILIPADIQARYMHKVARAADLLADDGEITLLTIENPSLPTEDTTHANIDKAKKILDDRKVKWKYIELTAKPHEIGYAMQTLEYMRQEKMQMIAIAAEVSERFKHFGKLDKEAILLNEDGFMVLCVNKLTEV